MKRLGLFLLFAGALAHSQDATDSAPTLSEGRKALADQKAEWKKLAKDERAALEDAQALAFRGTKAGKALAPTFDAAADLLEAAGKLGEGSELLLEIGKNYRAAADALAGKRERKAPEDVADAVERAKKAKALWAEAKQEEPTEATALAWRLVRQGSPLLRALAKNLKAIEGAMKKVVGDGEAAAALAGARELNGLLAPRFEGVATEEPKPLDVPT